MNYMDIIYYFIFNLNQYHSNLKHHNYIYVLSIFYHMRIAILCR